MRALTRWRVRRGGIMFRLLVVLAALFAAGAIAWMLFLPLWITGGIRDRTGFGATVASVSCNPFTGRLVIRGLVLTNPAGFLPGDFLQLREFRADGDLWSFLSDRIVLDELVIDVRKAAIVRRADGRSNVELFEQSLGFAPSVSTATNAAGAKPAPGTTAAAGRKFLIRSLALRFDELLIVDASPTTPEYHDYHLAVEQHYREVTAAKQLLVPDVLRRVAAENLGPVLARLVPGDFGRAFGDGARGAAHSGEAMLQEAGAQAKGFLRDLREKLDQSQKP
jgi:hypothetical protein